MKDFIYLDVGQTLTRVFHILDAESLQFIDDPEAASRHEKVIFAQLTYFARHSLVSAGKLDMSNWRSAVLRLSDFSDLGKKFILSNAVDNWLRAMDRSNGTQSPEDVRILDRWLRKISSQDL